MVNWTLVRDPLDGGNLYGGPVTVPTESSGTPVFTEEGKFQQAFISVVYYDAQGNIFACFQKQES